MTPSRLMKFCAAALLAGTAMTQPLAAQGRDGVLVVVGEQGPNSLDTQTATSNDYTRFVATEVYDRLIRNATKTLPDGTKTFAKDEFVPELATSWEVSADGKSLIFHLRKDAIFHDGSPVTAEDVKWSFDRAVAAGGFPLIQMGAGSLTQPEQFSVVDAHTFKITVPDGNKLALPDLAVPIPIIINSKLAKQHATADDPWADKWLATHTAGGGAYDVTRWTAGSEIVFSRFDKWQSGPIPEMKTVVYRQIASAGTRRALLESGDADISFDLPPKDFAELSQNPEVKVIGVPMRSGIADLELNTKIKPFDDVRVRRAIAYAIPYEAIIKDAMYGRAKPLFGAKDADYAAAWPVPSPYYTDLDKARKLLAEAGYPDGFSSQITFDLSKATVDEPTALLIQNSLAKIGVKTTVEKIPGANWFAKLSEKKMPMVLTSFHAWLDWPDYHFYWTYDGKNNSVFNVADYTSDKMDALIEDARFQSDAAKSDADVKGFVALAMQDVPKIPIAQPFVDVAMQKNITGYVYQPTAQLDFRSIKRVDK